MPRDEIPKGLHTLHDEVYAEAVKDTIVIEITLNREPPTTL